MAENRAIPTGAAGATNDQHQDSSLTSVTSVTADIAVMPHLRWTPARVEERLRKAAALRAALNTERLVVEMIAGPSPENRGNIGGIGSAGGDGDDGLFVNAAEAFSWLRWLGPDDAALVRARLGGAPWKSICWRFAISRPTADRRWRYALALIAWRLDGRGGTDQAPSLRCLLGMRRANQVPSRSSQPKR